MIGYTNKGSTEKGPLNGCVRVCFQDNMGKLVPER